MSNRTYRSLGFSLIELLLVVALIGLISAVCVIHFDTLQSVFSGESMRPIDILKRTIAQGRLWSSQGCREIYVECRETEFALKDGAGEDLSVVPFAKEGDNWRCKFWAGELTHDGLLKPSQESVMQFKIHPSGMIASTFVEFALDEDKEQYEINTFSGNCIETQW